MQRAGYKRCSKCGKTKPRDEFWGDSRARTGLHSWCKACSRAARQRCYAASEAVSEAAKADRAAARREKALEEIAAREAFATATADGVPPDFGHWLAGFIDGEGHFSIRAHDHRYQPRFVLGLRDDDQPILDRVVRVTGLGCVRHVARRAMHRPRAVWTLETKQDVLGLVRLLERFPLQAKKARDQAVWREAVLYWNSLILTRTTQGTTQEHDWGPMPGLHARLVAVRAYPGDVG